MANGAVTLSGAFTLDSTGRTNIETFMESIPNVVSNGTFVVLPDMNSGKIWIAGVEGGAAT